MELINLLNLFFSKLGGGIKGNAHITIQDFSADMRNTINSLIRIVANIRTTNKSRATTDDKRTTINSQIYLSLPKLNMKNGVSIFLSILVLVTTVYCKKDKGIMNLEWQNESLSLTSEICAKYRECADKEWKSIPENLKKFTEGRLDETQCQKRFRESNAYKLIGADPLAIQTAYKECHKQIMLFSCKDLQEGKIETINACVAFQKVQNGN
ncbi:LA_2478/LA_2722/LA_4182 family protein [Leptospira bourretii]|uniref:LA_2478/LA_2722/LA_4182 family protein n=1 Tax=Leptospira bourretii TaxID=2484962 RepID=UPI001FCC98A0|nr:hypothetical protein [Leptospira bourretii]